MAASEIKAKYGSVAAMTCTLASLASSSTLTVGRQTTLVDNSTTRYQRIHVWVKLKTATTSFAAGYAAIYLLKSNQDGTPIVTDGAGASDAALTVVNAQQVRGMTLGAAATTYVADFVIENPGPLWGLAVSQNTVAVLDSTAGSHAISYIGENPEAQ